MNKRKHRLGPFVRDISTARNEDVRFVDWNIIITRNGVDGELGFLDSSTLLTRGSLGTNHVLLCLVDVEAKKFFFVNTDVVSRKAFNNVTERAKKDALHKMLSTWRPVPKIRSTVGQ